MNWRWYITGFVVALTFFGISVQKSVVPNQEIIVQFNAHSITSEEAQQAISEVTEQLRAIGVTDFQVSEMLVGKLKVTYYSAIDVAVIKDLFKKNNKLHLDATAFNKKEESPKIPFGGDSHTYNLEVVKIQNDYGSAIGSNGLPVEIKPLKDQYSNQFVLLGISEIHLNLNGCVENEIGKIYHSITLPIDNTSHKIPEVRAGPFS